MLQVNIQRLIDDVQGSQTVRELRWPDGMTCPSCQSTQVITRGFDDTAPARQRYEGHDCHTRFDDLTDTIVVKTVRRRRLVRVRHRVVFGTLEAIEQVLAAWGWQIQTAFVERLNLDIRQRVAAVGRRVTTLCKGEAGVRHQLVLFQTYHNFCLPHASLCVPLAARVPTNGTGSARQWRPRTPAMAAGRTDHVWSLREVLLFRVPPWPQPVAG